MLQRQRQMTVSEFDEFALRPENIERTFEYIGGEIVEMVSNSLSSETAANILAEIRMFIKGKNLGRVTGADGGYRVAGERYIPDVAFISKAKLPDPISVAYIPEPPDVAVEVLSPSNTPDEIRIKVANYLSAGTVVLVVDPDPEVQRVEVYQPGQPVQIFRTGDTLELTTGLPGFKLVVSEIFPE